MDGLYRKAFQFQELSDHVGELGIIIDDQNSEHRGGTPAHRFSVECVPIIQVVIVGL
jgi:hypothetical protein